MSIIKDQVLGNAPHFEKHNSSHILSPIHLFDSNFTTEQLHMQVKLVFMCACILMLVGDVCGSLYWLELLLKTKTDILMKISAG